ncbi:ABC transporter permease [Fodinibius sp.]|uniref:ABC transporter permease n=1 Tax=Fodinibius sp. TaxID=1872440 RepID=UPI002ACD2226|nr:ABC transporter permease [Fodinibius sp.]MDZ7659423.1 ABC transporter permease [Fodinibius sp.]
MVRHYFIVVLSVFNGFFDVIQGFLLQNDPDIRIESVAGNTLLYNGDMQQKLSAIPELRAAASYVEGKALLAQQSNSDKVVDVRGISAEEYFKVNNLQESLESGTVNLSVQNKKPGMLVNQQLQNELESKSETRWYCSAPTVCVNHSLSFSLPRSYRFEVRGFYSRLQITDGPAVYIDKEAAQRLFEMRNMVSGIDLRLQNTNQAEEVKQIAASHSWIRF